MPSVPENDTVTLVLFQPAAFGAGLGVAVACGASVSRLIPPTVAEPILPALSSQ